MQFGIERRRTPRVGCEGLVAYTPCALFGRRLETAGWQGACVDVSDDASGLSFVTSRPLFTGRRLQLVLNGSARSAAVRWVSAVPEGYRVGVSLAAASVASRFN